MGSLSGTVSEVEILSRLERRILWLACWTIHHANAIRPKPDGLKVGGHQASCASVASIMAVLFFSSLRPEDRIAVKPHAGPVFHAIQYLLGNQTLDNLIGYRTLSGVQAYPSRMRDTDTIDFSTGSVGLGVAETIFSSLTRDYLAARNRLKEGGGRHIAIVGDAEFDEGNIFEALLEGWKQGLKDCWWIIDYNRQSLDATVADRLFGPIEGTFRSLGWDVEVLKYGHKLRAAFEQPDGDALERWIDACPNQVYSALTFMGGAAWREHLERDLGHLDGIRALLDRHDDSGLADLMTNLGGHDLPTLLDAFNKPRGSQPTCFIAYTIKGYGLPLAGHKDNHAGMMTADQVTRFREDCGVAEGEEWDAFAGIGIDRDVLDTYLAAVPFAARSRAPVGDAELANTILDAPIVLGSETGKQSTQEAFGRIMRELGRSESALADRVVTTSPDVTVSTNLGGWVNARGIFSPTEKSDVFRDYKVVSPQRWLASPTGQHFELGIAENNFFLHLAALGVSESMFGYRLLPVGTLYDPFIKRGLDSLYYALYQGARFILVATPSGISLAPEGGAHQSTETAPLGLALPRTTYFEPAFADELAVIMKWSFGHIQEPEGGSVLLRLTTRGLEQPDRPLDEDSVVRGGYWLREPAEGATAAIVYAGAVAPEVQAAADVLAEDFPELGVLAITSPGRLHGDWIATGRERRQSGSSRRNAWIEQLLSPLARDAVLVTVQDAVPAGLGWLGSVRGQRVEALGVTGFGRSGNLHELYALHGLDRESIIDAVARGLVARAMG